MSFRTRLITFFVLIVLMPMLAIGFLVFRLIDDSQTGKVDARVTGIAAVAANIYRSSQAVATADAAALAREVSQLPRVMMLERVSRLQTAAGLTRVGIRIGGQVAFDRGSAAALAPGIARVHQPGRPEVKVVVSELSAAQYVEALAAPGVGAVVVQRGRVLGSSFGSWPVRSLPRQGTVGIGGQQYRVVSEALSGFGASPVTLTVFSSLASTAASTGSTRLVAGLFILGFLVLALAFAILSSRGLQAQIRGFLQAARRLGAGDFSAPIETAGGDEFAALGEEFNNMSRQLELRLEQLGTERRRLRQSLLRIGQLFASNLDRQAVLDLALRTAIDAVGASDGRLSSRTEPEEPLAEVIRVGSLDGFEPAVLEAEQQALCEQPMAEVVRDGRAVASVAMRASEPGQRVHGVVTVARVGDPFSDDDRDLLRSLAGQATVALENVQLHLQVSRQAVTDQLTGLANHGHLQEMLSTAVEQGRRYGYPVGLILLDIDDFKSVNDTHGHQQGDRVLKQVARVMRESSRDADVPARYGGEEMALILPHTDLEGSYAIAERVRTAVEALRVPLVDGAGELRLTASLGVATLVEGDKDELISAADEALYKAKRSGKNRVERGTVRAANVVRAG